MSGADVLGVEGHGTTQGYAAGCRSLGGCPGKDGPYGQSCMDARRRQMGEWPYTRAVANGREVELLVREVEERTAPPPSSPKVAQAKRAQRKQQGVPLPVARPMPAAPNPVAPDLQQWPEESAPQPAGSLAKSQGALASHPKQRDHALATASEEHPMGLTLAGEPRKRCAPGTILVHGVLQATKEWQLADVEEPVPSEQPAAEPFVEVNPDQSDIVTPEEPVEEPRPRGTRVLDDALRTIAESVEMQRAVAAVTERALRTARAEIRALRAESAAREAS